MNPIRVLTDFDVVDFIRGYWAVVVLNLAWLIFSLWLSVLIWNTPESTFCRSERIGALLVLWVEGIFVFVCIVDVGIFNAREDPGGTKYE